jgi:hypothetical protein
MSTRYGEQTERGALEQIKSVYFLELVVLFPTAEYSHKFAEQGSKGGC